MATCYGGSGQPLDRDAKPNGKDTDVDTPNSYHHEDTGDFENVGWENHTNLAISLGNWMIYATELKLEKANLLCPSAPPEPLKNILKQYMDTLCSAQRQTNFANT